jgi:hypothetical protein
MFLTVGQIVMFFSTLSFELVSLLAWIEWESNRAVKTKDNFLYVFPIN